VAPGDQRKAPGDKLHARVGGSDIVHERALVPTEKRDTTVDIGHRGMLLFSLHVYQRDIGRIIRSFVDTIRSRC
jgi:hypothetical protein